MTNAKMSLMTKMVLNLIPPVSGETKKTMENLHFDISKLFLGLLSTYRQTLKNVSPDVYELVLRITSQMIFTYETNSEFREKLDKQVIPVVLEFVRKYNEQKIAQ